MTIHIENPEVKSRGMTRRIGYYYECEIIRGDYAKRIGKHVHGGVEYDVSQDERWEEHNALLDDGERWILETSFQGVAQPTNLFVGLHSGSLVDTSTLANVVEPSQSGYARLQYARNTTDWPTLALDAGDQQVTGAQKTFTAAATWTPVNKMILVSTSTGSIGALLAEADLSAVRSLVSQDQLNMTPKVKAS